MNKEIDRILALFKETKPIESCECVFAIHDGMNVCRICHEVTPNFVEGYIPYHDRRLPSSPYNKMTHFKEKIEELCMSVFIPDEVMAVCGSHQDEIRASLHQHRLKAYYSCVFAIMRQKGIAVPNFSYEEKEQLCRLFVQVEKAYAKYKKKSNMINYSFVLSKLCPMIGRDDIVPFLFVLHSPRKIKEYNMLWDKMSLQFL